MSGNSAKYTPEDRNCKKNDVLRAKGRFCYCFPMFDDEMEPRKKQAALKNLEPMSVDELQHYVEDLKAEIARADAEISKKKAYASAASSFFKT